MYVTGEIDHISKPRNIPHWATAEASKEKPSVISMKESRIIQKIMPGKKSAK